MKKKGFDAYALLGLANERWTATDAQIRAAYRRACLEHHPDKALINVTDEAEKERIQVSAVGSEHQAIMPNVFQVALFSGPTYGAES